MVFPFYKQNSTVAGPPGGDIAPDNEDSIDLSSRQTDKVTSQSALQLETSSHEEFFEASSNFSDDDVDFMLYGKNMSTMISDHLEEKARADENIALLKGTQAVQKYRMSELANPDGSREIDDELLANLLPFTFLN